MRLALIEAKRIWDRAPHCAFTDLVSFKGRLLCTFREGSEHRSPDGVVRVLASRDGARWSSLARLESPGEDLRDPKFVALPDGSLALTCGALRPSSEGKRLGTLLFRTRDAEMWSPPVGIGDPQIWVWRLTFAPSGIALGLGYAAVDASFVRLYAARDLETLEIFDARLVDDGKPTEHAMAFRADGTAICLLRCDPGAARIGLAHPPYREWTWRVLESRIGGPCLCGAPDGMLFAGMRLYDPVRTSLGVLHVEEGRLEELLALPSGGDTSYPGLVVEGDELKVSYYSSHEGTTAIYFARVRIAS